MEWRQALPNWIVGPSRRFTGITRGRSWKLIIFSYFQVPTQVSANQIALCKYPSTDASQSRSCNTRKVMWLGVVTMAVTSAQSFRHALRQVLMPAPGVNVAHWEHSTEPILDFWGPYAKLYPSEWGVGGVLQFMNEWMKCIFPFFTPPRICFQNWTKIKTYLRARGPPGVSGTLRSLRILRIGRIDCGTVYLFCARLTHATSETSPLGWGHKDFCI